jgi:RNA polymerase sigma factor (sigma-70 family)
MEAEDETETETDRIVARAISGDQRAARQLFDALEPVIGRTIRRAGFRDAALADVSQEVWRSLSDADWRALRAWRGTAPLEAYIGRIARNKALDLHRAMRRRRETALAPVQLGAAFRGAGAPEATPFGALVSPWGGAADAEEAMRERLEAALAALSPIDGSIIRLRYYEACSYAELAERLGRRLSYVGATLTRALARLRRAVRTDVAAVGELRRAVRPG